MKMTVNELRGTVRRVLSERYQSGMPIDIWDSNYQYSTVDTADDLATSARAHLKRMMGQGVAGPTDPKFLNAVAKRLKYIGVPEDVIKVVMLKLRMPNAR